MDTLLTCDNGIAAVEEIRRAKELGMTVIVTDHHEVLKIDGAEIKPPADAVAQTAAFLTQPPDAQHACQRAQSQRHRPPGTQADRLQAQQSQPCRSRHAAFFRNP